MTTAISSLVSIAGIWVLFFWLWREYRLDKYRQNLFLLRNELFDYAAAGNIPFTHPAYGMLRSTINGTIRLGHRFGMTDLVILGLMTNGKSIPGATSYEERWVTECDGLSPQVRESLNRFRSRLHIRMTEQLILSSAVFMFTIIVVVFWLILTAMQKAVFDRVRKVLSGGLMARVMERYDSSAFAMQRAA